MNDWPNHILDRIKRKILREVPKGWKPVGPVLALKNADAGEYVAIFCRIVPKEVM